MIKALLIAASTILFSIITLRAVLFPDHQQKVVPCSPEEGTGFIPLDSARLARFQEAIKLQTISYNVHDSNKTALQGILEHIQKSYPILHSSELVTREMVNLTSIYRIQGEDSEIKPVLFTGHVDVVPAEVDKWSFSPFSGAVDNEIIFGRGTMDNKNTVFGLLEAMEHYLAEGKQPKRTVYMIFGHDEEVMGLYGAKAVVEVLKKRGIRFAFMLDEGCPVLKEGFFPGYRGPAGLICTAEKGFATFRLSVEHRGGHASAPPPEGGAINIISNAINKLHTTPMPHLFGQGVEVNMFEHAAISQILPFRILSSNLWLFGPIVALVMNIKDSTRAQITTTFAFTQISGGVKDNVLPNSASVTVNSRILPGHTIEDVVSHVRKVLDNPDITIETLYANEASPISSTTSEGYNLLHHTIKQIFPSAIVLPGLLIGGTDTKWYGELCDDVYRFVPSYLGPDDIKKFHGHDEVLTVKNYEQTINFFRHLLDNLERSFEVKLHDEL